MEPACKFGPDRDRRSTPVARLAATPYGRVDVTAAVPPGASLGTMEERGMADKAVRRENANRLDVVHADCAGIDIGKDGHYVAVDAARFEEPVRSFGTFTAELEAMAQWLRRCGVRTVAMEATGVYWIPAFEVLDRAGFEVHLVNPRATKQVSGRKSDVLHCQWIRQLMSCGLLRGAYRVPGEVCALRAYLRQRDGLVRQRSRAVRRARESAAGSI